MEQQSKPKINGYRTTPRQKQMQFRRAIAKTTAGVLIILTLLAGHSFATKLNSIPQNFDIPIENQLNDENSSEYFNQVGIEAEIDYLISRYNSLDKNVAEEKEEKEMILNEIGKSYSESIEKIYLNEAKEVFANKLDDGTKPGELRVNYYFEKGDGSQTITFSKNDFPLQSYHKGDFYKSAIELVELQNLNGSKDASNKEKALKALKVYSATHNLRDTLQVKTEKDER